MEHNLISLTCQNKNLLHYKYLEDKNNNERCIAYIIEILTITAKYPSNLFLGLVRNLGIIFLGSFFRMSCLILPVMLVIMLSLLYFKLSLKCLIISLLRLSSKLIAKLKGNSIPKILKFCNQ